MTIPKPRRLLLFVLFGLQTFLVSAQESKPLNLSESIEREIRGGEAHQYKIRLQSNQTARVEIVQKGVDVSLRAYTPDNENFIETESPSGLLGTDLILVTAATAGDYKVEVSPADPRAGLGKYIIKLAEIRPTVAQDLEINAAAKKITNLAEETNVLRQKGTREGRRGALEKFQEIISVSRLKQDRVWELVALLSSGLICEQLGEMQNSLDYYSQGLLLARTIGNRQYEGTALNNLGGNYLVVGEYETAIFYTNQSLILQRETGNKRGEGVNLNNLGTTYMLMGDLPKAESSLVQALTIRREVKDQRGEGFALNNLGQVFLKSGDLPKAIDYLQQALILRRTISDRQGEAMTLRNLGITYLKSGDKLKALESFELSNTLAKQVGDRRMEADSFYWLALVEKDKGNLPKAIENIENSLRLIEQIRGEIISPDLRASYFSTVQQFYELYTELVAARYEKNKEMSDIALALQISERARTRSLVELLQEARISLKQGIDAESFEKRQDLQDSLNTKYRQRTQLLGGKPLPEQVTKINNEINALIAESENLEIKIRHQNPRYGNLISGTSLSAQEIQALLDDKTVLLEYKLGESKSFLWLITRNSISLFPLPPRSQIEPVAKNYYDAVVDHKKTDEPRLIDLSRQLSKILFSPVARQITDRRLAIVADGVLQYLPFSALAENNEVVSLPSASVLAELRRDTFNKAPEKTLAIFADAVFEANDPRLLNAAKNINSIEKTSVISRVLRDFNLGENLPRLLYSREEARNIINFVPKTEAVLNVDFDASHENATAENLANYRILHFATHGFLDTLHPERSGLVFSLYDKGGKPQDGFLPLSQIYNLNLNSDLVVLSACQTALGRDVRGEGLIGLTRGFMYAGAKRVVATLWKVDDAATSEFMKHFYQNYLQKHAPPVSALRAAQNEMKQIPRFKAPYFWAGFTLQGEWQ